MKQIIMLMAGVLAAGAVCAQPMNTRDYDAARTNTWSVYGEIGTSYADPFEPTGPVVGGGLDYNIRPWIRLGLGYDFWKMAYDNYYAPLSMQDGTVYNRNSVVLHAPNLMAEFNLLELWPNRSWKRLNLYAGGGIGYLWGYGSEYDMNITQKAPQYRFVADNSDIDIKAPFIPASLSLEYDIVPQLTLGVRAWADFLLSDYEPLPSHIENAAVTVRYNFGGAKYAKAYRAGLLAAAESEAAAQGRRADEADAARQAALRKAADDAAAAAARQKELEDQIRDLNAKLQAALSDPLPMQDFEVYFPFDSSMLTKDALANIQKATENAKRNTRYVIELDGYASTQGSDSYNVALSQRRADAVKAQLIENGISAGKITSVNAKGEAGMDATAKSRVVKIILK